MKHKSRLLLIIPAVTAVVALAACGGAEPADTEDSTVAYTEAAMADFGWAPGFAGATGQIRYVPSQESFQAEVSASGLKPNHTYNLALMGIDLSGKMTQGSFPFTTDGAGEVRTSVDFSLAKDVQPLPAYQVHLLVVDPSATIEPANPLGIPNPIPLACFAPMGFRAACRHASWESG